MKDRKSTADPFWIVFVCLFFGWKEFVLFRESTLMADESASDFSSDHVQYEVSGYGSDRRWLYGEKSFHFNLFSHVFISKDCVDNLFGGGFFFAASAKSVRTCCPLYRTQQILTWLLQSAKRSSSRIALHDFETVNELLSGFFALYLGLGTALAESGVVESTLNNPPLLVRPLFPFLPPPLNPTDRNSIKSVLPGTTVP